ncbi:MAG: FliM/FliN family flagellar motor switch protein [Sedimentisphaerales bacterium]|nr:FliM/FliN family flagellar motor switch protein [Sedimentisphaerales bacterium]
MRSSKTLTRQQIIALLSSAQQKGDQDTDWPYKPYDWRRCRYFTDQQMALIRRYLEKVAVSINAVIEGLCQIRMKTSILSVDQQYASALVQSLPISAQDYCLPLVLSEAQDKGLMVLPGQAASTMVQWLLGVKDVGEGGEEFSGLEESLLTDCVKAIAQCLNQPDAMIPVAVQSGLIKGAMGFMWDQAEAILAVDIGIEPQEKEKIQIRVMIPCRTIDALVSDLASDNQEDKRSDTTAIMMGHLEHVLVKVAVQVGVAQMRLEEVMGLGPGDVLVMDKSVHDEFDILLGNKRVFGGTAVIHKGQLAVMVTG